MGPCRRSSSGSYPGGRAGRSTVNPSCIASPPHGTHRLGTATHLRDGHIYGGSAASSGLDRSRDFLQADLRHLVVVVDVAHPERPAVVAGERDLVRIREPDRRLMREGKRRVRGDRPDRRARAEDAQERGVEHLEERRARVRRVEELRERALAERAVVPERGKGARVDELCASPRRSGTGPVAGSAGSAKAERDGRGFVGEEIRTTACGGKLVALIALGCGCGCSAGGDCNVAYAHEAKPTVMTAMLDAATMVRVWGLEGRLPRSPASVGFCSWPLEPCGVIARSWPLNGWGAGRTTGLFGSHDYLREWFC